MALVVERRDGSAERQVLIGMVVSRAVLGPIAARWEAGLFGSRWGNLVGGWAVEHYLKYRKAPGKVIETYFDRWAEGGRDRETIGLVSQFLEGLSDEYAQLKKSTSPDYLLDQAALLFNKVRITELRELLETDLEVGDIKRALARLESFHHIEVGTGSGVNVLTDEAAMIGAFESKGEVLVEYPGALKNFFSTALGRDAFIAFMGKEKVGKSFWLQDLATRGVEQGRNVAYFEVGDNSQAQVLRRFAARFAERPLEPDAYNYPTSIEPPTGKAMPELGTVRKVERSSLSGEEAAAIMKGVGEHYGPDRLKLSCHPNSSISVRGIESILEGWERDGWHPDIVVVDYADILAPLDGRAETRDQINASWKAMRALSQRLHCLLVTATQTDADSYDAKVLRRDNFSEDKRKYAHVTGMCGINQTAAEKEAGFYRLNWVVLRELEFSEEKCVWCACCLPICNPAVLSTFGSHDL